MYLVLRLYFCIECIILERAELRRTDRVWVMEWPQKGSTGKCTLQQISTFRLLTFRLCASGKCSTPVSTACVLLELDSLKRTRCQPQDPMVFNTPTLISIETHSHKRSPLRNCSRTTAEPKPCAAVLASMLRSLLQQQKQWHLLPEDWENNVKIKLYW